MFNQKHKVPTRTASPGEIADRKRIALEAANGKIPDYKLRPKQASNPNHPWNRTKAVQGREDIKIRLTYATRCEADC